MLALVLEGTRMLGLDVHMDGALVLLDKRAMGALKLTGLGANVFEGHGGTIDPGRGKFNFFGDILAPEKLVSDFFWRHFGIRFFD